MKKYLNIKKKDQKGFTLLEYCAGAAVMIGIVVGVMSALDAGLTNYFTELAAWLDVQGDNITALGNVAD